MLIISGMPAQPLTEEQLADAARLKAIYEAKKRDLGFTQESLAAQLGWNTQSAVSQYLNGRIPLNTDAAVKFSKALHCVVSDFSPRLARGLREQTAYISVPSPLGAPSVVGAVSQPTPERDRGETNAEDGPRIGTAIKVPVVGSAQLGDNGFRAELEYPVGHGDGYVTFAASDPAAYALRCIGDSMKPRIKAGEFVVVYPSQQPGPGDEVLVRFTDGRVMIKEMLYVRDDVLHLLSVNEAHGKVTAPLAEVEKLHYVAAIVKKAMWAAD